MSTPGVRQHRALRLKSYSGLASGGGKKESVPGWGLKIQEHLEICGPCRLYSKGVCVYVW